MEYDPNQDNAATAAEPLGYCPTCDYRLVTAGVCPECGNDVAQNRIRSHPRRRCVRKWVNSIISIGITAVLIYLGQSAFKAGLHYRLYSDSMLVASYPDGATLRTEIVRRLIAGRFSDEQVKSMIIDSFSREVYVRSPRPIDLPLAFHLDINARPGSVFAISATERGLSLQIDGCEISGVECNTKTSILTTTTASGLQKVTSTFRTDWTPTDGEFRIGITLNFSADALNPDTNKIIKRSPDQVVTFDETFDFRVSRSTACDFMECRDSDQAAKQLRDQVKLAVCRSNNNNFSFDICADMFDVDLYFDAIIEEFDAGTFNGSFEGIDFVLNSKSAPEMKNLMFIFRPDGFDRISCRVTYDIAAAFERGATAVYPFVLEWDFFGSDTYPDAPPGLFESCPSCGHPFGRPPDRVIRFRDLDQADAD